MKSLDLLKAEHHVIEAVLRVLEAATERLAIGREVPTRLLADVLEFLEYFADRTHHAKEDDLLFPALAERGYGAEMTPMAALSAQHEIARAYLREMHAALTRLRDHDEHAREVLASTGREYVVLLREHIRIEDHYFGAVAADILTPDDDETLVARMKAIDDAAGRGADRERYLELIADYESAVAAW